MSAISLRAPAINRSNGPVDTRLVGSDYIDLVRSVKASELIGYWPLNESAGTLVHDYSGNRNNGIASGVRLGQAGIGDGQSSMYFDGLNDYVDVYSVPLRDASRWQAGTLMIWAKPEVWLSASTRYPFRLQADANNFASIEMLTTGGIACRIRFNLASSNTARWDRAAARDGWVCILMAWDKSLNFLQMVVNGLAYRIGVPLTGTAITVPSNITIGSATPGAGLRFQGNLAHAAIWKGMLSTAEAATLYRGAL